MLAGRYTRRARELSVARPTGVEPVTFGFGNQHSIQLSYGRTPLDSTARLEATSIDLLVDAGQTL